MIQELSSDVRLCVVGGFDVGKSAISVRFLTRRFIGEYQRNVQLTYGGVIEFGPDVINYELKDTTASTDIPFLTTWPSCLAIVYSIVDHTSFVTASKLLENIDSTIRETVDSTNRSFPLALIANKNDLGHFRRVSEEEGRNLALKYGASFWEASASEDYYSVFRPLHSLIVETFLSNYSFLHPSDASEASHKSDAGTGTPIDDNDVDQRHQNDPLTSSPRRKITPTFNVSYVAEEEENETSPGQDQEDNVIVNPVGNYPVLHQLHRKQSDDATATKSSPLLSALKRKRSLFKQRKSVSLDTDYCPTHRYLSGKSSASPSSTPPSTPPSGENTARSYTTLPSFVSGSSITINVRDEGGEDLLTPTRYCGTSRSFSKADRKRLQLNSSMAERRLVRQASISQSHSLTDLKALQVNNSHTCSQFPHIVVSNTSRDVILTTNVKKEANSPDLSDRERGPYGHSDHDGDHGGIGRRQSVRKKLTSMFRALSQSSLNGVSVE